ncbi:glycohydrolase toxin TNT-related protein [Streptomyces sp. NPDC021093]|uniref:TNT domain-containing protein n=1 Tax=Streptomyces sp. NPDC021093 TaxID=3365112 RepID=UPI0037912AFF
MTTAMVMALSSGVAAAAVGDDRPTVTAPSGERPSATPPPVHGAPVSLAYGAPGAAASANRPPNSPKAPEVGPPFKQTSGVWQTNTLTPTLRNTPVDPDKDKTTSTFEVWTVKANGDPGARVNLTDDNKWDVLVSGYAAAGTAASVNVPKGKLKDGWTYLVRSSAYDGAAYETDWSPWSKFKVTAPVVPPVVPVPGGDSGNRAEDVPADAKAKWQQLAKEALAAYDRDQAEIADVKKNALAHGADAVKQLNLNNIALPENGYFGVPRQFIAARVQDNKATVSTVGGCEGGLHCTQKFRTDYVLNVDMFYCTAPGVAADIGNKCPAAETHWDGFAGESQSEEFSREYNRITDGWDKFMGQMLGDLPKIFMQCVTGDTSTTEPPVVASPSARATGGPILRATGQQCAEAGMQLGAMAPLGGIRGPAKIVTDPLVEMKFTAAQISKAKGALNDLKAGKGISAQHSSVLNGLITSAIKADKSGTGGLSFTFNQVIDMPKITAGMRPDAQKLMAGYKPFGNLTIEEWFHQFWNKGTGWVNYPDRAAGFPDGFQGPSKPHSPKVGEEMDRFGTPGKITKDAAGKLSVEGGGFLAPKDGTPYSQRALPPANVSADKTAMGGGYHVYKWTRDWGKAEADRYGTIEGGKIAPWFGQPGGGVQYKLPKSVNVQWLLENKYIVEVTD